MIHNLIEKFKIKITIKEMGTWFGLSFLGVFTVYIMVLHKELNSILFIEFFAYAVIFTVIMAMTKSYSHFIDGFYQPYIDKHSVKRRKK